MRTIQRKIVSALIISNDRKILMGKKDPSKGGVYPNVWHIPGGGIEEGETMEQALAREVFEEVGIDIKQYPAKNINIIGHGTTEKTLLDTGEKVMCEMEFNRFEVNINDKNADFFFPQTADGRGSSVEILPGGQNLGEITDLKFFTNKLFRGLRIPASYLPTGVDDGTQTISDGRVGTALIQEWRFNQYCMRLQSMIVDRLDKEFKMFMRWRGINIDGQLFDLCFTPPQNFASYRQADIDSAKIATFTQLEQIPYLSKRFLMKRYLGLTEMEMSENEIMWKEEKGTAETPAPGQSQMRAAGISAGGIASDLEAVTPPPGAEAVPGEAGAAGAAGLGGGAGAAPGVAPTTGAPA